jgi:hypothetical protein
MAAPRKRPPPENFTAILLDSDNQPEAVNQIRLLCDLADGALELYMFRRKDEPYKPPLIVPEDRPWFRGTVYSATQVADAADIAMVIKSVALREWDAVPNFALISGDRFIYELGSALRSFGAQVIEVNALYENAALEIVRAFDFDPRGLPRHVVESLYSRLDDVPFASVRVDYSTLSAAFRAYAANFLDSMTLTRPTIWRDLGGVFEDPVGSVVELLQSFLVVRDDNIPRSEEEARHLQGFVNDRARAASRGHRPNWVRRPYIPPGWPRKF